MSTIARRFPGHEHLVYRSHCDEYISSNTRKTHMRKHGPKATDSDSPSEGGGSEADDMDVQGEMAEGNDEEMQELASQTSHMLARDACPDKQANKPDNVQDEVPELEDNDGFRNINAGDFCKYEQWYAKDHLGEDVEMYKEIDSITMLNWFIDPNTILRFPWLRGFPLNDRVHRCIAWYFHTNFPQWTFHAWLGYIPKHAECWGKLRIPDSGNCIRHT
ncbi:unnamed protein product [Rhizoctonia solani]|uniref:Uncharacterized protein n=1 Tax=Rhizoctonia solani TaxID=456999 RepID=A0A8H3C2B7_9AGAM|nr:unnamed protein product [Rhizoctonia solani]